MSEEYKILYKEYEIAYKEYEGIASIEVKDNETGKIYHSKFKLFKVIKELQQELTKYKERNEKAVEYIKNYDVFKEFSFPLMKRDVENQVKSSIQYEFDTSIKKSLLEILEDKE